MLKALKSEWNMYFRNQNFSNGMGRWSGKEGKVKVWEATDIPQAPTSK